MKPKRARTLTCFLFLVGVLIILLSYIHIIFLPLGLIVAVSSLVPVLLFYRCPHCKRYLGRTIGDHCPHCGERIDD